MKILFLCADQGIPVLGRKGAAVHVRELTGAFTRAGHQVGLVARTLLKTPWETPASLHASIQQLQPPSRCVTTPESLRALNREVETQVAQRFADAPPDCIYERAALYVTAGVALAWRFRVPHIVELNAPLAVEDARYRKSGARGLAAHAERFTLTRASSIVVVSSSLRAHAMALGVGRGAIHVLPNGVNTALFHPAPRDRERRRQLRLGSGPVLGFVGGLRPWHGVEILPRLLEQLCARHRGLRLVIAGDGPLRGALEREFRRRGLARRVVITGLIAHEEIPAVIRQFDVALAPYPPMDHAFYFSPLKLFEYLACGIPVVAAKLGQIAQVVRHGRHGLLYPPGDLAALAAACEKLLARAALRAELGRAGAELVRRKFTWDRNASRVVRLARRLGA